MSEREAKILEIIGKRYEDLLLLTKSLQQLLKLLSFLSKIKTLMRYRHHVHITNAFASISPTQLNYFILYTFHFDLQDVLVKWVRELLVAEVKKIYDA